MKQFVIVCSSLMMFACGELDITGEYLVEGPLTLDTCASPSAADSEDIMDFGRWFVAAVQDEFIFMKGDFVMMSEDGETFLFEESVTSFWTQCEYTTTFNAKLSFTDKHFQGPVVLHQVEPECYEDPVFVCDRMWELTGYKRLD